MQSIGGKLELLTPKNSMLLLVDFQPSMFRGVGSNDKALIKAAAIDIARAAKILDIPVVLSSIHPDLNGVFIKEVTDLFPNVEVHARKMPSFDALEDQATLKAIQQTGRRKIVMAGLWTSMCFAFTSIHAVKDEYEVYGLMDAAGDSTPEAHKFGIKRMLQIGIVPVTTEAVVSEWMHDWDNPKSRDLVEDVFVNYGAMIGWE